VISKARKNITKTLAVVNKTKETNNGPKKDFRITSLALS
jgi:hypothetical protein